MTDWRLLWMVSTMSWYPVIPTVVALLFAGEAWAITADSFLRNAPRDGSARRAVVPKLAELLGIDPLTVANEGKVLIVVPAAPGRSETRKGTGNAPACQSAPGPHEGKSRGEEYPVP